MIELSDLAPVGKINKTHGIGGEMSMTFDSDAIVECIDSGTCLIMDIDGIFTPFFAATVRPRSSASLLVKLDGIDSQEEAATYVGHELYMLAGEVPEEEEDEFDEDGEGFYAGQLIGFKAINDEDNSLIGEIIDIDESTENVLFIVRTESGANVYIPVADEFITEISTSNHTINFDLPAGLLSI